MTSKRTSRKINSLYGPNESSLQCIKPGCDSYESKVIGEYYAGGFYIRRRRCLDCGQMRASKQKLKDGETEPTEPLEEIRKPTKPKPKSC